MKAANPAFTWKKKLVRKNNFQINTHTHIKIKLKNAALNVNSDNEKLLWKKKKSVKSLKSLISSPSILTYKTQVA